MIFGNPASILVTVLTTLSSSFRHRKYGGYFVICPLSNHFLVYRWKNKTWIWSEQHLSQFLHFTPRPASSLYKV